MAKFGFNGVDNISASFEELAQLTDEDKLSVIRPAAELLVERQREKITSLFRQITGDLAASLNIEERIDDGGAKAVIYLKGKHSGSSTGKRKGKRRSNGNYSGTNAEIGYILEYGSPRIPASHWMENANEEASDDVAAVQQDAWNEIVARKGF